MSSIIIVCHYDLGLSNIECFFGIYQNSYFSQDSSSEYYKYI